ncbi:hypothetical protein GCM10010909_36130 [Acidocella aquatica]|uniref:Aminoglycoside phosphotransferase domain-containing protein n=1 Tax=Acidocella aquatica TaxID=1922313 RepID=A0ABQ6A9R0_9PROT|nr:phosphotransferase family protein [Acidocella aquatica]GLR68931.1 hypothetical protein GCM10010909_36130 [Acidocella aquatica]
MSALENNLRLLRDTCRDVREKLGAHEQAAALGPVVSLLDDMLVQQGVLPALAQARDAALNTSGAAGADLSYWQGYQSAVAAQSVALESGAPAERIDTAALQTYLATLPGEAGVRVVAARVVSRGFSKKTVLVSLQGNRTLPAEIALRIDQPFNYLGTTVSDEFPWLRQLAAHGARIAQPFALEGSGRVLGQKFLVSAKVNGGAVGGNYVSPPRNPALVADIAHALAGIHRVRLEGLRGLQPAGPHIMREVDAYYRDWQALGAVSPALEAGFAWVRRNLAAAHGPEAIIHNDYNFNNMMIEGDRLLAVVDWEFAHIGTPAADLGYFYYSAENTASFDYFLDQYRQAGGTVPAQATLDFYIFWGQLRLAVMGFQAVAGLNGGNFKDIRFAASLGHLRSGMMRVCGKLMELPG